MKKILNVIGSLDIGGAEINSMNILRHLDLNRFEYHFLIFNDYNNDMEDEAISLGAKIKRIIEPKKNYRKFMNDLDYLMKNENYHAIHVNTLWNTGIILYLANKNRINTLISHSHSTQSSKKENLKYKIYKFTMKKLIKHYSDYYISCGKDAGAYLYGDHFFNKHGEIIYNGINIKSYEFNYLLRNKMRKKLGISKNDFLIGHVGRLAPVKNHKFMLDLYQKYFSSYPDIKMFFIGDGPERENINNFIKVNNLENKVVLLGKRKDVNHILQALDVLLLPSFFEGFPLSLVEAQTTGIPTIISDKITKEAILKKDTKALSLSSLKTWEQEIIKYYKYPIDREKANLDLIKEKFDIKVMIKKWEEIYD